MSGITIKSDGNPQGTRVYLNGDDITHAVRSVTWRHDANNLPVAEVEMMVVEESEFGGKVEWVGLERVPFEALEAEIQRRKSPTEG